MKIFMKHCCIEKWGAIKWMCSALLLLMILLLPCQAADETFRSLEYGFAFDYPKEAEIDIDPGTIIGIEESIVEIWISGSMDVIIGVSENNRRSADDLALLAQSRYEDESNLTVLDQGEIEVNGSRASFMESLMELEDEEGALKIKDVFLVSGDKAYQISCRAVDNRYKQANQTYFGRIISSFKTFPIDEEIEANLPGFPVITGDNIWSSPAMADLDGDGSKEIVFGTNKGNLHAIGIDGEDIAGFPLVLRDVIRSSPAIGDIDGDGSIDITVGCDDGMLYAFSKDGSILPGFPVETADFIASSPSIGDIDGDGMAEVVVGSRDGGIYAWNENGTNVCGFPLITSGAVWSSPALGDIDGDGILDIVVGSMYLCRGLDECMMEYIFGSYNGELHALGSRGESLDGFPKYLSQSDNIGYSSPILCDINKDGKPEIVIAGSYNLYVKTSEEKRDDYLGFPRKVAGSIEDSQIAMGDLNGDGMPEIVAGATDGRLYVWRADGRYLEGFPIQTGGYVRFVTLGDIDGDGMQEILGGSSDNRVYAWWLNGTEVEGFPKVTSDDIETAPTLSDLEGDGSLELVVGSDDGQLYAWKISDNYGELDWPMLRQNLEHTGVAVI